MKKTGLLGFALTVMVWGWGQPTFLPEDRMLFEANLTQLAKLDDPQDLSEIGKHFLGTPYVEKTLEIGTTETVVVNLRGFDCTTFVENTLAFAQLLGQEEQDFEAFAKTLETIRYKNGNLNGYASRLHYFTDWIRTNAQKGLVRDITAELGGVILEKPIDFMGSHRELYPFLADDTNYQGILDMEEELAKETLCYLPQDAIAAQENLLGSGDIIALTTAINGLDATHTGIAIREADGRIHLLHGSSSGAVVITETPLVTYLKKVKGNIGIMVARPMF